MAEGAARAFVAPAFDAAAVLENAGRMKPKFLLPAPPWIRLLLTVCLGLASGRAAALGRVVNTTLTLPQDPATLGYRVQDALGGLRFDRPVALATPPGETHRLFVVEQSGRIIVITNLGAPTRTVFLTLTNNLLSTGEQGLLGLAFHPDYARNGRLFTFRTINTGPPGATPTLHDVLAEFRVDPDNPNRADPATEVQLFRVRDQASNHNGGDLHFGPDGYLYVAVGDEGGANDQFNRSQRITGELFAGLLRLDVDRRPGSLPPNRLPGSALEAFWYTTNYAIPADNPYVGATNFLGRPVNPDRVRTEFWSVGLRNPWRMAFDVTGELWVGDVGQGAREAVFLAGRGSNHGWAFREGSIAGPRWGSAPPGFLTNPAFNHVPPLYDYTHGSGPMQGRSITGGRVYRGARLPALYGAYVFADYVSGNVWALRRFDGRVQVERLLNVPAVSAFGADPRNGDLLLAQHGAGQIVRLMHSATPVGTPLPPTLADTGAFADLATLTPHAGLVPYAPNVPFWSDGADKRRWFAVTHGGQFITFRPEAKWSFPTGMVWVKHFELQLTNGVPESARRLETRFLVRNPGGVYGVTYRWTDPPTNAVLVPEQGLDEAFLVQDAGGLVRTQVWRYPGRAECLQCHTPVGGGVLGMDTAQFNGLFDHGHGPTNQLAALAAAGYFSNPPAGLAALPALAPPEDEAWSVEWRARSWLEVNCAMCHQPGGTGQGRWDVRTTTPLSLTGLLRGALNNDEGDPANRLVAPGDLAHSMIHSRLTRLGEGRMPPLASTVVDEAGAALLARWITNGLAGWQSYADWQVAHFGATNAPLGGPTDDFDGDGAPNRQEYLTGTDPKNPADAWGLAGIERRDGGLAVRFPQRANRRFIVETADRLGPGAAWRTLEAPGHGTFIAAEDFPAEVGVPAGAAEQYLRVRVEEP